MQTAVLLTLTLLASALCWLPVCSPHLNLSPWSALLCVALISGVATKLSGRYYPILIAVTGTYIGVWIGYAIWWPDDPIAGPWVPLMVGAYLTAAIPLSCCAAFIAVPLRRSRPVVRSRHLWWILFALVGYGPFLIALSKPLATMRMARNDQLAAERFTALKAAVEGVVATQGRAALCDGSTLKSAYAGRQFRDEDWSRITGNYVKQDGYVFMIYCHEKNGYTVDAHPEKLGRSGTRQFCTDESRVLRCGMSWNRSRHTCLPCG